MKTITVNTSNPYPVYVGTGLLSCLGNYLNTVTKGKNALLLSDSNVYAIYGKTVTEALQNSGYSVFSYTITPGEASKSAANYLKILNFLAEHEFTRTDSIVALGGGVVGDLGGFVSATFLRGIPFVQIPTSLLAMVDSSVGGKTAIDLPAGKNLVGTFYQPRAVICDLQVLETLPLDIFLDGCAEVIKYGILFDRELFAHLKEKGPFFDREYVVSRCVALKRDIVNRDEYDLNIRQLLNLGHTIGHSIEVNSGYRISHGKAVAIGTNLITACSAAIGFTARETFIEILELFQHFGLPTTTNFEFNAIADAALLDKKRANNTINLILPKEIGNCIIHPYPVKDLETLIKAGLMYANQNTSR